MTAISTAFFRSVFFYRLARPSQNSFLFLCHSDTFSSLFHSCRGLSSSARPRVIRGGNYFFTTVLEAPYLAGLMAPRKGFYKARFCFPREVRRRKLSSPRRRSVLQLLFLLPFCLSSCLYFARRALRHHLPPGEVSVRRARERRLRG